jgi:hypothetical protein
MAFQPHLRTKIARMEEAINFPPSLRAHQGYQGKNLPLVPFSDLRGAITSLAEQGRKVAIVTGFYIPAGDPPATETDGPPGALILAEGLKLMGMSVTLVSDHYSVKALKEGLSVLGMTEEDLPVLCFPMEDADENSLSRWSNEAKDSPVSLRFAREFWEGPSGKDLSHLIYIERVGPNHTLESFLSQASSNGDRAGIYEAVLPPPLRNRCLNARLMDITRFTAKTHLLLDAARELGVSVESIGVGDRGNEIGSGRVPWEALLGNEATRREAGFLCRITTDFFVSCGISNWGGYALLAGVALALGRTDILHKVTPEQEWRVLDHLVHHGPAIDGITCRQEHSVDGIEFGEYMKVIEHVKEIALEETPRSPA